MVEPDKAYVALNILQPGSPLTMPSAPKTMLSWVPATGVTTPPIPLL